MDPRQRFFYVFTDRFGAVFAGAPLRAVLQRIETDSGGQVHLNEVRAFEKARLSSKSALGYAVYHGFRVSRLPATESSLLPKDAKIVLPSTDTVDDELIVHQ